GRGAKYRAPRRPTRGGTRTAATCCPCGAGGSSRRCRHGIVPSPRSSKEDEVVPFPRRTFRWSLARRTDRRARPAARRGRLAGAEEIAVILPDDTTLKAQIVGRDTVTDLALLKVEPKQPLPEIKWGDSNKLRVGDWVLAVGNPFGLGGSVTAGIVSARARDIHAGPYDDFLQP